MGRKTFSRNFTRIPRTKGITITRKEVTKVEILFLVGRIVVGLYYFYSGFNHFLRREMMVQYSKSMGVPLAELAVPGTGLMLIVGGLSILLGVYPVIGVALLVIFLIVTAFMMHRFWGVDEQTAMTQMPHFLKNIGLAGSALMFLAISSPWPLSLWLG